MASFTNSTIERLVDQELTQYVAVIQHLHSKWTPHPGQIKVGQALFDRDIRSLFIQCGRKWGKTELILYFLWRWAFLNKGAHCYYISPYQVQSKEIVWANQRLQHFGPRSWLKPGSEGINNTELRLNFVNGSFIKCDGSDNFDRYRGIQPHLVVLEEYKDHRQEFMEAMRPNLAPFNAPSIYIGTPPEQDDHFYWRDSDDHKSNPNYLFYEAPTWDNPHISRAWLDEEKKRLYDRGEGDVWEREYGAKRVKGGASKIFPMLNDSTIKPHSEVLQMVSKDKGKLQWFLWADPAAASCFGVLFVALNPYSKTWYVFDEIYESKQDLMSVTQIGTRIKSIRDELYKSDSWLQGYDEAATWFALEMLNQFSEHYIPSQKLKSSKEEGLSLIKDILLQGKLIVSDRCVNFYRELDHYRKDKNNKIPKLNDHLIDCFRYILIASSYSLVEEKEYNEREDENFRGEKLSAFSGSEWEMI